MNKLIILPILLLLALNLVYAQEYRANQLHQIHTRHMAVSAQCNNRGFLYLGRCYCLEGFKGNTCSENSFQGWNDDINNKCDDLTLRLDHLYNISPENGTPDDNVFPRLRGNSIGSGTAAYGEKGSQWVAMHLLADSFNIFNKEKTIKPQDVGQGALGNCYLLAALASLANIRNGQPITEIFETLEDNANRTYVARFFLDGKVRYVAVDDFVPSNGGTSASFSKPVNNNQFWVMILEKMWAKIHGNYMITEGGWQTNVWKAITQAPINQFYHTSYNADTLFTRLQELLNNQWAIGSATIANTKKDLVQGHAYSVLGAYAFTNEKGENIKLVKVYNPWHSEDNYPNNPWVDSSSKWTTKAKASTTYNQDNFRGSNYYNDGIFYLSHQDYYDQFGITNWAEIYEGFGVNFQEIPLQSTSNEVTYTARFNYTGSTSKPLYVSVETIDSRLIRGCPEPFSVVRVQVTLPNGSVVFAQQEGWESVRTAKIADAQLTVGTYKVDVTIRGAQSYHKYFTISTYSEKEKVQFFSRDPNNTYVEKFDRLCPNNCSRHGICNTAYGVCTCDIGWNTTSDCSVKVKPVCLNNCNGKGTCMDGNVCKCQKGYDGADCKACVDAKGWFNCNVWYLLGYFNHDKYPQYRTFIETSCAKSSGAGNC